jgi:hypothetical protein
VLAGGALEAGQVGSYCQPQLVGERRQRMRGHGGQVGEGLHALTMRRLPITVKLTQPHPTRHKSASKEDPFDHM